MVPSDLPFNPESPFPPARWYAPHENSFGVHCLDLRGLTQALTSFTTDPAIADSFLFFQKSSGDFYPYRVPPSFQRQPCRLRYPIAGSLPEGPLFVAAQMEDKWNIYRYGAFLYFARSWTGDLMLRAELAEQPGEITLTALETDPKQSGSDPLAALAVVDFLIKTHLLNLDAPCHIPHHGPADENDLMGGADLNMLAATLFKTYGRWTFFASYADTTRLPATAGRSAYLAGLNFLGWHNLKREVQHGTGIYDCPVAGCGRSIRAPVYDFKPGREHQCPDHKIYIFQTTFEQAKAHDNLLWHDPEDEQLLADSLAGKRENRLARENSEDALTWNIFRFMERRGLLTRLLWLACGAKLDAPRVYYWGCDPAARATWQPFAGCCARFGEQAGRGSEPDLIVASDDALVVVESKFLSSHDTTPRGSVAGYQTGCDGWYDQVFQASFDSVAVAGKKYQLMRHWLIGSRLAEETGRQFYLLLVSRAEAMRPVYAAFKPLIVENERRHFVSTAWESLYGFLRRSAPPDASTQRMLAYLENKTAGYDAAGQLRLAFDCDPFG